MEALLVKRLKPSLNLKLGLHKERSRFCMCIIERCSVKTLLLLSIASSNIISNLTSDLQIYFTLTKVLWGDEKLRCLMF